MYGSSQYLCRILDQGRRPLGYLDVQALKKKWEAGEANAVSTQPTDLVDQVVHGAVMDRVTMFCTI